MTTISGRLRLWYSGSMWVPLRFSSSCSGSCSLSFPWCCRWSVWARGVLSASCSPLSWRALPLLVGLGRVVPSSFAGLVAAWEGPRVFFSLLGVARVASGVCLRSPVVGYSGWSLASTSPFELLGGFSRRFGIFAVFRHFAVCGVSARRRDLRHVFQALAASSFPSWRIASEFFWLSQLQIQEAAERRGLHRLR